MKPIILKDDENGKVYTLEFDRATVKFMESRGLIVEDIEKFPMKIYDFFWYAFRKNHPNMAKANTDKIIDDWGGVLNMPEGVLERLAELYIEAFNTTYDKEPKNPLKVEL